MRSTLSLPVQRLLAIAIAGMLPAFGMVLQMVSPESTDPLWLRGLLAGWFLGLFALSYYPAYRDWLPVLWIVSVWEVTLWYMSITILNGFASPYALGSLMVLPAAGSVLHQVTAGLRPVQGYYGFVVVTVGLAVSFSELDAWSSIFYIGCTAGLLGIMYLTQYSEWQNEQALLETKHFYKQVLEQLPIEVAVFDPEARYVHIDPESVSDPEHREWLLGRTNEEYCTLRGVDRVVGRQRDEAIRTVARTGTPAEFDETLETEDGPRHYLRGYGPVTDLNGMVTHVAGYGIDITARKQRERALRRVQQEAEAIFQHVQDGIFHVDVQRSEEEGLTFRFLRINTHLKDLTGFTTEDLRAKTPRELLGEKTGCEVEQNYARCVAAGEVIEYEEELPTPAGTKIWHTKLSPVIVDGEVVQIVGIARNITERKRREEQLLLLDRMFQHDMRADISTTLTWVELSREGFDAEKAFGKIQTSAHHMLETLNAAGTIQKALRSGRDMDLRAVDVRPYIAEAAEVVQARHPEADIIFQEEGEASTVVRANDLLGSVFENLIANGVRHNDHPDPEVHVRITRRTGNVRVIVADNGPGISPEERMEIFGEGTQSLDSPGMGLGLYLVDRLVEYYGGAVTVTDNDPRGARFIIDLPDASSVQADERSTEVSKESG